MPKLPALFVGGFVIAVLIFALWYQRGHPRGGILLARGLHSGLAFAARWVFANHGEGVLCTRARE